VSFDQVLIWSILPIEREREKEKERDR
jgi:hypothetical protein